MILDLSAGKRAIWLNRLQEGVIWVDLRPHMIPTVICDSKCLPFPDNFFSLIVFDPPHMVHGPNSTMGKQYGSFSGDEIRELIDRTSREAYRVSIPQAFMSFKWNSHDVRLDHALALLEGWTPLFGHHFVGGKRGETSWIILKKNVCSFQSPEQMSRILNFNDSILL